MNATTNAPATIVYPSRTGGNPHTVTLTISRRAGIAGPAGTLYATCTCDAYAKGVRACWAMHDASRAYNAIPLGSHLRRR